MEFKIPKSIPSGNYLVRVESIALHQASNPGGAQVVSLTRFFRMWKIETDCALSICRVLRWLLVVAGMDLLARWLRSRELISRMIRDCFGVIILLRRAILRRVRLFGRVSGDVKGAGV